MRTTTELSHLRQQLHHIGKTIRRDLQSSIFFSKLVNKLEVLVPAVIFRGSLEPPTKIEAGIQCPVTMGRLVPR